jgi:ABC-type sugar transport system ATPase subunit
VDAISLGIAYVTENRFEEGIFANLSLLNNAFSVKNFEDSKFILDTVIDNKMLKRYINKLNIDLGSPIRKIIELSGGKQQKVMLIRWFLVASRIIIFDEPTRGVDIASKVDIYNLMNDLIRKEAGIILISSDIEELIGMCDRIIIMRNGSIAAELTKKDFNYESIYHHMSGNLEAFTN